MTASLLIGVILALVGPVTPHVQAASAIAFVGAAGAVNSGSTITVTYASSIHNTIFVEVDLSAGSANSVTSITDNGGDTFSLIRDGTLGLREELWSTHPGSSHPSTTFTITVMTASGSDTAIVSEYSGVGSLGSVFVASGESMFPTITATLSSSSDWGICGIGSIEDPGFAPVSGTMRLNELGPPPLFFGTSAAVDNTGSTTVTCSVSKATSNSWVAIAIDANRHEVNL